MGTSITLQAAVTHLKISVGSDAPPCLSMELSLDEGASDIVFANDDPVAGLRFSLKVSGGEPLLGTGDPVPSGGVGILTYIKPYVSRWPDVDSVPASVSGWATIPQDRFNALWLIAVSPAQFLATTSIQVGPFSHRNRETWIWDNVADEHLVISRVEFRFSRQP